MSSDENFLARWSQRKREAAKLPEQEAAPEGEGPAALLAPTEEEEPFDLELLPKIEDLTSQTDITPFMHKAVPEALRNAALKKMWALDPAIRDYVGEALDYAWDWNAPGGVPGSGGSLSQTALDFTQSLFSDPPAQEKVNANSHELNDDAKAVEEASQACEEPADSAPEIAAAPENAPQITTPALAQMEQEPAHPVPPQRRHGGALPRL